MNGSAAAQERFWLDEGGECPAPPGRVLVEDEVAFLEWVVQDEPLFIRGSSLSRWARSVARARGWSVRSVEAPAQMLLASCPDLDPDAACAVVARLGAQVWQLPVPLRPSDVLAVLHGESLRQGAPGAAHAARWLVWWTTQQLEGPDRALAAAVGGQWSTEVHDPFLQRCYATESVMHAEARLEEWLGLLPKASSVRWPGVELPAETQDRLLRRVKHHLAQNGIWREVPSEEQVWPPLREPVARLISTYLIQHPSQHTDQWLVWLGRYLNPAEIAPLRRLRQPDEPSEMPIEAKEVITWYRERYLPWRMWVSTSADHGALRRSREIGCTFGTWYLEALSEMLAGADDKECLAWVRALRLNGGLDLVTLLVVVDGLAPHDVDTLLRHVRNRVTRLQVMNVDWAFAQIPTVTKFTKPTLVSQELTGRSVDEHGGTSSYRVAAVVDMLRNANRGDVVAWVLAEPDRAYHFTNDQSELESAVDERIYGIAGHLSTIVERTPPEVKLQVVVTADHGRLMGDARRTVPVPDGLQPHGRAAWGKSIGDDQLTEPYRVEGNIVWLHPSTYGLPADDLYAVILDDQAFLKADGKGGSERFPHGGLFPEEVLVPWVVFRRDVRVEPVTVTITGDGVVGHAGSLSIVVVNPNAFAVDLVQLLLTPKVDHGPPTVIPLDESVDAMSTQSLTRPLAPWPDNEQGKLVPAILRYRLPDGGIRESPSSAVMTSKALYRKDDILSGLK